MIIRNYEELSSKGNFRGRRIVLDTIEGAVDEVNFYNLVREHVKLQNGLRIGSLTYDLSEIREIFVVGAGKQVTFAAAALEDVLGDRIADGVVIEKRGTKRRTRRIAVLEGGHPIPDIGSMEGAKEILRIAQKARNNDLVIMCVTGGCTSLTMLPPKDITLEDVRNVCKLLQNAGAPIEDMNTVRKHLSQIGGGKLSIAMSAAQIVSLIAVDEVGRNPWGPTVPDTTTFANAIDVLVRYDLWNCVSESIRNYFKAADPLEETPKIGDFERLRVRSRNFVFAENGMLCSAAKKRAADLGIRAEIISTSVEGEAKEVAVFLASMAKEIENNARPFRAPCVLIAGGETTVGIQGECGEGGRNQELALAVALRIGNSRRIVVASMNTDGTDGPTDIAGAIVDGYTIEDAKKSGMDPVERLKKHDSSSVFRNVGDAIYTNDTGTNLMDLIVVYVMA